MAYDLRQELHGHTGDVRCACVLSDGTTIVTGSRDRSVRIWLLGEGSQYIPGPINYDHPHWVNAIESLQSGFATGCHDHLVRVFDSKGVMMFSLGGHTGPIASLSVLDDGSSNTKLVSGSWDGSARVWDLQTKSCIRVLGNHENIVCVLGLPNGMLATGSTGRQEGNAVVGFKVRLFAPHNNEPAQVLQAHEGPVRCLSRCAPSSRFAFASASNDGSLVLYSDQGAFLNKLINPPGFEGGPAFNFCVREVAGDGNKLVAACDDCCARVWNSDQGQIMQELEHPATVWWVVSLPNGDLCTASGDGIVRLFSADPIRHCADSAIVSSFKSLATQSREAQRKKMSPAVDVSTLTRIQDAPPGASEQQVRMFNKDGSAYAFQWSAIMQTWIEIGPIVNAPEGKAELDGEYYDKVVPVEVEDLRSGSGAMLNLKLGFNTEDNPYTIANAFIKKHELPDYYLEEIVGFINQHKDSGVPTLTSRAPASTQTSQAQPAPTPVVKRSIYFPLRDGFGIYFEKGSAEKAVAKIKELNAASATLSDRDIVELEGILNILKQTSRYHATEFSESQINVLTGKIMSAWALNDKFAVFDLIRAVLTHPDGIQKFSGRRGEQVFMQACAAASSSGAATPLILASLRAACNMFRGDPSMKSAINAMLDVATSPIELLASSNICRESGDANIRTVLGTLFFNSSNALYHYKPKNDRFIAVLAQLARGATLLLSVNLAADDEGAVKAMSTLGCVGLSEAGLVRNVAGTANACSGPKVKLVWKDVAEFCGV